MPPEHWVYDDLKWDRAEVFRARRALDFAHHMVAEGNLQGAVMGLNLNMQQNQEWFTPEEQFEIYALIIDLHLQQQQREQARDALDARWRSCNAVVKVQEIAG